MVGFKRVVYTCALRVILAGKGERAKQAQKEEELSWNIRF